MKKIIGLIFVFALGFSLASCSNFDDSDDGDDDVCEHVDGNADGACDECGEQVPVTVTEEEWKNAHAFTNAKLAIKESIYSNGKLVESYDQSLLVHDSLVYNEDMPERFSPLDSYRVYYAFSDCYSSFELNENGEYTCAEIEVDGMLFKNAAVTFDAAKNLSTVRFEVNNGYYDFTISLAVSDHGVVKKPERDPFVFEGEEASKYATEREVEGRSVAYVTMTIKGYGDIKLLLDATTAPITVKNFLELVNSGFYDGLTFHRVIDDFMIQGGDPKANGTGGNTDADGNEINIKGEFSKNGYENDIKHIRGVISMARGNENDSASSQFFICNADASWLDGSYAAFGYVIDGMSVVDHVTYDTYVYGDSNGGIDDKSKQAVIGKVVIDKLVGITLETVGGNPNELPVDPAP